jgi:pentatricopeptide repeat protein
MSASSSSKSTVMQNDSVLANAGLKQNVNSNVSFVVFEETENEKEIYRNKKGSSTKVTSSREEAASSCTKSSETNIRNKENEPNSSQNNNQHTHQAQKKKKVNANIQSKHKNRTVNPGLSLDSAVRTASRKTRPRANKKKEASDEYAGFDVFSYIVVFCRYRKEGLTEKMMEVLDAMIDAGFTPDVTTYNLMMDALGKDGQLILKMQVFDDMENAGLALDKFTYYSMIDSLEANNENDLVDECIAKASARGVKLYLSSLHFHHPAQSKELYINLHGLSVGDCRDVLRTELRLVDNKEGRGGVDTVVVVKGFHTNTDAISPGGGGAIVPSLLKYMKEELKCDCIVDPNNAGRILITL